MTYHLLVVATFANNGDRSRALNAINNYIANWNAAHPGAESWQGSATSATVNGQRAVNGAYTTGSQATADEGERVIHQDIDSNAYLEIVQLTTWAD